MIVKVIIRLLAFASFRWYYTAFSCRALKIQPLPKFHVESLSLEDFDSVYLDKLPVVLKGATACPSGLDFSNAHNVCQGTIPGNFVHTKETKESIWAGLKAGEIEDMVDFESFLDEMGKGEALRFMFDLPMVEICPSLPPKVHIPPHFVNMFSSHFMYRHLKENENDNGHAWKGQCPRLPFFNMYLAEGGFQTDLHIDALHTAFIASMCVGRKRWRIMAKSDFVSAYDRIGNGGLLVNGTYVMSSVNSPIDTWSPDGLLESLTDVTIYEGILEPGEILYIPAGAPHAATTLDQSIMVASNDRTLTSLREATLFCKMLRDQNDDRQLDLYSTHCKGFRRISPLIEQNFALYGSTIPRKHEMTLAEATGCKSTFDMLDDVPSKEEFESGKLVLTPHNFREEISKGPLIVMKSQNVAGVCLYFLKHWDKWTKGFDPPIRVAVLSCIFQNQCPPGNDQLYKQLIDQLEARETPTFVYVKGPKNLDSKKNPKLSFSYYHGFMGLEDDLPTWISLQTGSKIVSSMTPLGTRIKWYLFHFTIQKSEFLIGIMGPALFGILIAIIFLTIFLGASFLWDQFCEYVKAVMKRSMNPSRPKLDRKVKEV